MKTLVHRIYSNPKYAKAFHWGKLISVIGSGQLIVQLANLACGILIIRLIPTKEYAFYTLTNTLLGTLILLSDGGIVSGVMAQGAKVWNDKESLGTVINTGMRLRRKFAFISLVIMMPLLAYLLHQNGASVGTIILISLSILPVFIASLSDSLLEIIPKLHQQIIPLQKNQVVVSIGRLILSTIVWLMPWTYIAMLASGIPRMYGNIKLKNIAITFTNEYAKPDNTIKHKILKDVKKILPGALYFCFASQINIWIISTVGSTNSLAEVGALGRLGMLLNLLTAIISTLFVPRFAKMADNKKLLLTKFFQIIFVVLFVSIIIIGLTYLFPQQILFILGNKYKGLSLELILSITASCLGLMSGTVYSLSISRSYNISPVINIGVHIIAIVLLVKFMNLNSTKNVLIFSILEYSIILIMFLINFIYHLNKVSEINEAKLFSIS